MADEQPPKVPSGVDRYASGSNQAWMALGYLVAGMAVWGFIGWLVDRWLSSRGIATAVGIMVGAGGGVFMIVRTFALPAGREDDSEHHR